MTGGVYLHIPFCRSKCRYCSFASRKGDEELTERYCRALVRELLAFHENGTRKTAVDTVYIGGGTPSLLAANQLSNLIAACREAFDIAAGCEISIEANPATLRADRLRCWRDAGVNRISLGAQSFSDDELAALGRIHTAQEIRTSCALLRECGFLNLNLDLMLGLPEQTADSWRRTLESALAIRPTHLSVYMLELDAKTPLFHAVADGLCTLPDEDMVADAYGATIDFLETSGYGQYEISNFALPGCECRHNLKYWRCEPVFAFGAAAHSFDGAARYANTADLTEYLEAVEKGASPRTWHAAADARRNQEERIFLGLRLCEGLEWAGVSRDLSPDQAAAHASSIQEMVREGLLEWHGSRLRLTRRGILVSNEVFEKFV